MKKYYTTYATAVKFAADNKICLPNMLEIEADVLENIYTWSAYEDEDGGYKEIASWWLLDSNKDLINQAIKHFPELIFSYSILLDCYVLAVPFGNVSWDDALTECSEYWAKLHPETIEYWEKLHPETIISTTDNEGE